MMPARRRTPRARVAVLGMLALTGALAGLPACGDDEAISFPVAAAPPSRHETLRTALTDDARAFGFRDGDWLEDLGDAPFYGLAWLSRAPVDPARRDAALTRARLLLAASDLFEGDIQEKVMAALGVIEHIAATGDRADLPLLDDFVDRLDSLARTLGDYIEVGADRSWALRTYGPTSVTALVGLVLAQYALDVGGDRAGERLERARAIEAKITERAQSTLADAPSGRSVRGYAFAPGEASLVDYPNIAMLLLEARLFRLTREEVFRLQARAIYAALQPLKLSDTPARYSSTYAIDLVGAKTRDVSTLSSQNYLALGLLLLFEITGESRYLDEADRMLDAIEALRGPWCIAQVHDASACMPVCGAEKACVEHACTDDRCTTGLLHHTVDGRLALPGDGTLFCSGCNLQTLYVLGYRRTLAGQAF